MLCSVISVVVDECQREKSPEAAVEWGRPIVYDKFRGTFSYPTEAFLYVILFSVTNDTSV